MEDEEEGVKLRSVVSRHKRWFDTKGNLHRLDGPAIIYCDGDMDWYAYGELHRDDGPARIWPSAGLEEWYKNGELYEPSAHDLILWKMKKKES